MDKQLESEIREIFDNKIESRISKEVESIREMLKTIFDTVKIAAGVIVGIFAVLGITSWFDIQRTAKNIATERVDSVIQSEDSATGVKSQLDELVNRAILSSTQIELIKSPSLAEVTRNDWLRLRSWVQRQDLDSQTFGDVLYVLDLQPEERKIADANEFLAEMLSPTSDQFPWMQKKVDKRLAILENFRHEDLGNAAEEVLTSRGSNEQLKIASLKFLRKIDKKNALGGVLAFADDSSNSVQREALTTAVLLQPGDARVRERLNQLIAGAKANPTEILPTLMGLYLELDPVRIERQPIGGQLSVALFDEQERENGLQRNALAAEILTAAISCGVSIGTRDRYEYDAVYGALFRTGRIGRPIIGLSDASDTGPEFYLNFSVPVGGSTRRILDGGSFDRLNKSKPYWIALSTAANSGNKELFMKLLPAQSVGREVVYAIRGSLTEDAAINVTDEKGNANMISDPEAANEVLIFSSSNGEIQVSWESKDGVRQIRNLEGFSGKGHRFYKITAMPSSTFEIRN